MAEVNPAATPGFIWLNGAVQEAGAARIDPSDRGLLLGDGLFETIAVRNGQICDVERHFARLRTGALLLRLNLPMDLVALNQALQDIAAANALREGGLRLTLTRGPASRGLLPAMGGRPTLLITAFAAARSTQPVAVIIASQIRRDETSPLSRIKSLNYLPNILARMEAVEAKADDAILLNQVGHVAETSAGNVFVKRQGRWLTPFVADGALPGIRRAILLEAGRVAEARIDIAALRGAEAVCIGNVLSVRAVSWIGEYPIPILERALAELSPDNRAEQ